MSSEAMHRIYGGTIVAVSTTYLMNEARAIRLPQVKYAAPAVTMLAGSALMIDPLLHGSAAPANYGAETRQHLLLGGALLAAGSIDLAHEARALDHFAWGFALPAAMLGASATFLFHAQHGDPGQHALLQVQHRMLGATLAVAAVTKGLAAVPAADDARESRWPQMRTAWIIAAGLAGIQLLLYSEGRAAATNVHEGHTVSLAVSGNGLSVSGAF